MFRIRQWFGKGRRVIWEEPALPPFVKTNPMAAGVPTDTLQPGDLTMAMMATEFLNAPDDEDAE
jgi:hypothetical protein